MTQEQFDRRFDRVFKIGEAIMGLGLIFAVLVGVPLAWLSENFGPLVGGFIVFCVGATLIIGNFMHDIHCNPRWKR